MTIPEDLLYTKTHEWIDFKDDATALVGVTDFAQEQQGDVRSVSLPNEGEEFAAGDIVAAIESVQAGSDMYLPVTGEISAVNTLLADEPERINGDPYDAWIVEVSGIEDRIELLSAEEYEAFIKRDRGA